MCFVEVFGPWLLGWSQEVCSSGHYLWLVPMTLLKAFQFSMDHLMLSVPEELRCTWIYVVGICIRYLLGLVTISFVETWEIFLSSLILPSSAFLAPRNQCSLKAPGETKAPGWADCAFECFCSFGEVNLVLYFMLSCIYPLLPFHVCLFFLDFFKFVFSFSRSLS